MHPVSGVRKGLPEKSTVNAKSNVRVVKLHTVSLRTTPKRLSAVFLSAHPGRVELLDETALRELSEQVIEKLKLLTDAEFAELEFPRD